jgi:trehalose synthase
VIGSNVGGIPIQIEDAHNGFLLESDDYDGFAERIIYLLKHPDDKARMGQNAREYVRTRFLITRLLSDYLDMLNAIING